MPNTPSDQESGDEQGLFRYANPADPTGPMLHTRAEVDEATKGLTEGSETSPNTKPRETKRKPATKKR